MGEIFAGVHQKIARNARDAFGLKAFVETGTYKGQSALWAKDKFERVITIEISPNFFKEAESVINNASNVLMILGDSREWLASVCRGRDNQPTLFWLDSHWIGDMQVQDPKGCPVIDEIRIINENFFGMHVIMVDDYAALSRLGWAKTDDVIRALVDRTGHDRQVRIMDDIYFAAHRIPEDFDTWKY